MKLSRAHHWLRTGSAFHFLYEQPKWSDVLSIIQILNGKPEIQETEGDLGKHSILLYVERRVSVEVWKSVLFKNLLGHLEKYHNFLYVFERNITLK